MTEIKTNNQSGNVRLQLLTEAASELLKRSDPLQFLDSIYERICELVELEVYFHFGAVDGDANRLRLVAYRGLDSETAASLEWLAMGQFVCGTVAQTCSPMSVSDVQERSDEMTALIRDLGITSYICHPLTVRGKLLGTLSFGSRTRPSFSEHEVELLRALSDLVALALDRRDRDVALARQNVELRVLQELSHAVSQAAGVDEVCQAAVQSLTDRMAADRASVLIFDRLGVMRFRAWSGLSDEYRAAVDGHSPWGPETRNPDPVLIENVERADSLGELKPVILREGIRALGFFPLMGGGALQGKFMVYYDRPHVFAADEQEQLRTVAEQIGVRIERAGVQERLRESEARFRRAIERAPIPILFHTEDDELLTASDTVWERTGYRPEEIHRYTDWLKLAYGDRWEAVQAKIEEHFAENKLLEPTEFRLRTKSGEERDWVFSSGPPERMDDGRRYFVVMANDITDLKRAHSELHQTAERLRHAMDAGQMISWEWNFQTNTGFWDERTRELYGVEPGVAITPEIIYERMHPDDRDRVMAEGTRSREQQSDFESEFRVILPDGSERWMLSRGGVINDEKGQPERFLGVNFDITSRKQIEAQALEREQQFRRMADSAPVMMWVTDPDGNCTYLNRRWAEFTGQTVESGLGQGWLQAVHPDDRDPTLEVLMSANDRRESFQIEYRLRRADGAWRWAIDAAMPHFDAGGSHLGFVGSVLDITDRKRAEEALLESQSRYQLVNDALPVLITYINRDLIYEYCNAAYETWFGVKPEEIVGRPVREVIGDEPVEKMMSRLERVFKGEPVSDDEYVVYKGGVGRHIHVEYIPQQDESGEVVGFYALVEDISERKRFEEQLRQWNDQLEARIEERTETVERQANQLRRLTMRLAKAEQVERRALAERIHGELQQLLTAALMRLDQMGKIVEDERINNFRVQARQLIMDATQEARSVTTQLSPPILHHAGLGAAIQWMADWMHQKYGLRVIVDVDESAEPDSDEIRGYLFEAARELLFNVVKHAGVNEAHVSMKRADSETVIEIIDEGRGTDAERAIASHESDGGFGLFSLTERLQMAGCDVNIRTAPGEGFHATIRVPRETFAAAAAESASTDSEARTECRDGLGEKAGAIRILVVDDHRVVREGLVTMLEEQPDLCVVGEAATGRDAVNSARELLPDVILMDVNLPDFSGIQATREILAESDDVIIVALSVNDDEATRLAMREAGAADYLTKDSESDLIFETVRSLTRRT